MAADYLDAIFCSTEKRVVDFYSTKRDGECAVKHSNDDQNNIPIVFKTFVLQGLYIFRIVPRPEGTYWYAIRFR